jgi:hypothetical protein
LWQAAIAIALAVFAFSSAYFSALRYPAPVSVGAFWRAKIVRLGPPLLVINAFLTLLFVLQGRPGLLDWQTPFAMLGLSVPLDWYGLPHTTPFGSGLWFFTVLVGFYLVYPLLAGRFAGRNAHFALAVLVVATSWQQMHSTLGYMLWLVVLAFGIGLWAQAVHWRPGRALSVAAVCLLTPALLGASLLKLGSSLNYALLVCLCFAVLACLMNTPMPGRKLAVFAWLEPCVLEIYLVHQYTQIRIPGLPLAVNYVLTMATLIAVALALSHLRKMLFRGNSAPTAAGEAARATEAALTSYATHSKTMSRNP